MTSTYKAIWLSLAEAFIVVDSLSKDQKVRAERLQLEETVALLSEMLESGRLGELESENTD